MDESTCDVVVVGGGISGLTAAWHLHQSGVDVRLLEAQDSVGGCMRTESRDGFLLEKGPFNVIVRHPTFEDLLVQFADEIDIVSASKAARKRFVYRAGQLLAVPSNPISLLTTGLLSFPARLRLLSGLLCSPRASADEETIEQAAARRFGPQVAERMVSAVIAGIFAGDSSRLSLAACFPGVGRIDSKARSLLGFGLSSALGKKKGPPRRWRGMVSISGGLGALTEAMGRGMGSRVSTGSRVVGIERDTDGYTVRFRRGDQAESSIRCRRLALASPAGATGRLLEPLLPDAARTLASIESASLVVLNLGFRAADIAHPLQGFGFLVPAIERAFPLMGALFADSIFPHHAPAGHRLLRVFVGGAHNPEAVQRTDDELLTTALDALRGLLGVSGDPVLVDVCRYPSAIPQYHVGHREKISRLRGEVASLPGLFLLGNYLDGVSLNDCVRLGAEVAGQIEEARATDGCVALRDGMDVQHVSEQRAEAR